MDELLAALAAVVALAAAVRGIVYLYARWEGGVDWLVERRRRREILGELLAPDGWPNGAESLQASHRDLYDRVAGIDRNLIELTRAVEEVLVDYPNGGGSRQ